MNGDYTREDVLTADDVPGFPSGTATVYRVGRTTDDRHEAIIATLDARGFLRTLNDDRAVFPADECEVLEVVG